MTGENASADLPALMNAAVRDLQPRLEKKRRRYRGYLILGVVLIVSFAAGAILANREALPYPVLTVISLALIPSFILYQILNRFYRRENKRTLINGITGAIGFSYNPEGAFPVADAIRHGILPAFDRHTTEDGFEGNYRGVPVALQEIELTDLQTDPNYRKKQRELTTYQGFLVRIRLQKKLEAHTVVIPSNAMDTFFRTRFSQFQPVRLSSPAFEKKYDVLGTDQIEARVILNPSFMERFMEAAKILKARWMEASFLEDEIMLAVRRMRPLFEAGPLWKPVTRDTLLDTVAELETVLKIVDILRLNRQLQFSSW